MLLISFWGIWLTGKSAPPPYRDTGNNNFYLANIEMPCIYTNNLQKQPLVTADPQHSYELDYIYIMFVLEV